MERVHLSLKEQLRLVIPYAYHNIKEQFVVVVPVCLYIVLFQLVILRYGLAQAGIVTGGIVCVFLGLAFFLEGIRIGLAPVGETVGNALPKRSSAVIVLVFAFLLGLLASFGEPVLGTLQMAGARLQRQEAPLLFTLLVGKPLYLVGAVALGVGVAVLIGTIRFLRGWSLKPVILPLVTLSIVLTIVASMNPLLASAIGLAWDTGAVIVGPVLCPLVLALGVGVCRASGKTNPSMAGFGMVGLISVVPIAMVIILTFALYWTQGDLGTGAEPAGPAEEAAAEPLQAGEPGIGRPGEDRSVALPASVDFGAYYPRLRLLALPASLDFGQFAARLSELPSPTRETLLAAYHVDEGEKTIRVRQRIPPEIRKDVVSALRDLGYDLRRTPLADFQRAYDIVILDEASLRGRITLKTDAPPAAKARARQVLDEVGYADRGPLLLDSLVLGARAILPIFLFLLIVMFVLKARGPPIPQIVLSVIFAIVGLCLFFFGLSIGLGYLGNQLGGRLPTAFLDFLPLFPAEHSLYPSELGKIIIVAFAVLLGYGATLAEPAFNVLGQQVEDITQGAFKKTLFGQSVAVGVGIGAGLGIFSLLYNINLLYLLIPPYILLAILTVVNKELFVNIAWDGGAVTTGPVTVPLKLAIGLSLSQATGAGEGFGVLALASAYPVLIILVLGLLLTSKKQREA